METVDFLKAMSASLDDMRTASEFVDIVLVFGEVRLPCHKVVLASNCEYFKRMFLAGMKESASDDVIMEGIDSDTGVLLVKYLYSGNITITEENAPKLLPASHMLLLCDLTGAIEKFLCKHIQPANCVPLLNLSHLFECQDLIEKSRKFIVDKWDGLSNGSIVELSEDDMEAILKEHECQEDNFLRLQSWVKSIDGGEERFPRMLDSVILSKCRRSFVHDTVMDEELMLTTKGMKLIQQALKDISSSETKTGTTKKGTSERQTPFPIETQTPFPIEVKIVRNNIIEQGNYVHSQEFQFSKHNFWWCIYARWTIFTKIHFGIQCRPESESRTWSCKAECELRLLNHEKHGRSITKKKQHVFRPTQHKLEMINICCYYSEDKQFIKDGCFSLEANIMPLEV